MNEPLIADCACGLDHWFMLTDIDGTKLLCVKHRCHQPCRKCYREEHKV